MIEFDEPPVKDQPPTEESGTPSDLAPMRVLVKQLIQKTQQWEYMVEWSGGLRTWCTADGAFASKVIATAAAPGASSDPSVDPALMRQLVTDFDMLGRKGKPAPLPHDHRSAPRLSLSLTVRPSRRNSHLVL